MPKRSSEENINYYHAKIRKLQKKQSNKKQRRRVINYSSSDSENNSDNGTHNDSFKNTPQPPSELRDRSPSPGPPDAEPDHTTSLQSTLTPAPAPLDSKLLEALGDATEEAPMYGSEIHSVLAQRWLPILKKGLNTDIKEKLLKGYAIPENCRLLKAPSVNPELRAAVTDLAKNRDKKIQAEQDQLGLSITAINLAIMVLLTQENNIEAMKILSDGCRILSDLHFTQSQGKKEVTDSWARQFFLTNIQDQERDETSFGVTLSDKIKETKAIERQSKEIKKTPTQRAFTSSIQTPQSTTRSRFQGNWLGPFRFRTSSREGRSSSQYRNQYQYRGGPVTLAPPAHPVQAAPRQPLPSSSTTSTRRAPTRH